MREFSYCWIEWIACHSNCIHSFSHYCESLRKEKKVLIGGLRRDQDSYFMWVCKLLDCKKDLVQIWQVKGFLPLLAWVLKCSVNAVWSSQSFEQRAHLCWIGRAGGLVTWMLVGGAWAADVWYCGTGGTGGTRFIVVPPAPAAGLATAATAAAFKWLWYIKWLTWPFQNVSMACRSL